MKKRISAAVVALLILAMTVMLSGCFNDLLYGTWRLSYTADEQGKNRKNYLFPVTMDLRTNGDVYMLTGTQESLFGTFTRNKNLFTLKLANPEATESNTITGAWVIIEGDEATELHLYPDEKPICYILQRTTSENTAS